MSNPPHLLFLLRYNLKAQANHRLWIYSDIWAPHQQTELIDVLSEHYKFTPRLKAIMKSVPPPSPKAQSDKRFSRQERTPQSPLKDDLEVGEEGLEDRWATGNSEENSHKFSHYGIAKSMEHYQSSDIGTHCEL